MLREIKGFTQAQLAEKIGVTDRYISMIERGISSPSFDVIALLASALDTLPANLFLHTATTADPDSWNEGLHQASPLDGSRFAAVTGTSETDMTTGRMVWSDAFNTLLGYRPGEIVPDHPLFLSHIHPEDRDIEDWGFRRMLTSQRAIRYRLRIIRSDNTPRLVECRIEAQHGPGDVVVKVFRTLTDITDRVPLESSLIQTQRKLEGIVAERTARLNEIVRELEASSAALSESERKYRLLADNSEDVIWALDLNRRFTYVSPSIVRLRGITPEEVLSESLAEIMTPESYSLVLREYERLQMAADTDKTRQTSRMIIEQRHTDGHALWVEVVVRPQFDESGRMIGHIGVSRDCTERKRMEDALKERLDRFDLAFEGTGDGIWDWDLRTGKVSASRRCAEMLGCGADDPTDTADDWWLRIHPEDQPRVSLAYQACAAGKTNRFELEFRMRHADGTWRWILSRGICLADENGVARRMVGAHTDITRRKARAAAPDRPAGADSLTGAIDAAFFREHGREAVAACKRFGDALTVFVLDIDHFATITEAQGRDAGNAVLATLASACMASLRETDIFCRLEGDEFAALLPRTDARAGAASAEHLRKALEDLDVRTGSATVHITASIGLASFQPRDESFEVLLTRAETALFKAKRTGRNRIVVA